MWHFDMCRLKTNLCSHLLSLETPNAEMPTIPILAQSFRFSSSISALLFWTSKFRKIRIVQAKMVPDKIKDVTPIYTPILRTFYVAVDNYT